MFQNIVFATSLLAMGFSLGSTCSKDNGNTSAKVMEDSGVPETPRIHFVQMSKSQPEESDPATIWYDDFENEKAYMESYGTIDQTESFDSGNGSVNVGFKKGAVDGNSNRKVAFGDFPGRSNIVSKGKHFDEIYWRIYVKHEYGWEGAPAKMSRATSIVSDSWQQAMMAHVWNGQGNTLTLDPARGVKDQTDSVVTTHFNDFENLKWLGNTPCSSFQVSSTEESGYWVLVESYVKLNTPGLSNGLNKLWIDGRLEVVRTNLNLRGSYTEHGINAVFLEAYWNAGASKTEGRWYDNFVISTKPVGPVTCPVNPVLYKTAYHGPGELEAWQVELATDHLGNDVVFKSGNTETLEDITIGTGSGTFTGSLQGKAHLVPGATYFCRVRQKSNNGAWSDWSRWHQPFEVGE